MAKRRDLWTNLAFDSWSLGMDASTVIGLRMMKLAAGGAAAQAEAQLMVSEKMVTSVTLPILAMTGQLGASGPAIAAGSLAHLRHKVRANRRRLTKG